MRRSRQSTAWTVVAAASALMLIAGCGVDDPAVTAQEADADGPPALIEGDSAAGFAGTAVEPAFGLPSARLTSDRGSRRPLEAHLDRPVSVFFFGYTHCPDVCSLVMADLTLAVARMPARLREQVRVVLVTSDPARDDAATLHRYLSRFDPDFMGLTGDLATIVDLAGAMGIAIEKGPRLPSGGYEVGHGSQLIGYVGGDGVLIWSEGMSVDDLTGDLVRLAADAQPVG